MPVEKDNTVCILTIMTPYGTTNYYFDCADTARRQLYEYVRDNWEYAFSEEVICPEDDDAAVKGYFIDNESEGYILVTENILTEPIIADTSDSYFPLAV